MPPVRPNPRRLKGPALVALIGLAVAGVAPMTGHFEGKRNRPYLDSGRVPTVCYGETQVEMRVYSDDECARMLQEHMRKLYAPVILKCVPDFADPRRLRHFQAAIDASYNAGPGNVCRSPAARAFNAGRWADGCAAFPGWHIKDHAGQVQRGLVLRRIAEERFCLTGKR